MERISPKIEIINHFDNLINRIDIDIDSSLEKYTYQTLRDIGILKSSDYNEWFLRNISNNFKVEFFHTTNQNLNSWPESMKVVDYLKQIRMKTIEELKKAQEETLEHYKLNSERFKDELTNEMKIELFAEKFYFQVNFKQPEYRFWPSSVFTFVTDFYMPKSNIDSLE